MPEVPDISLRPAVARDAAPIRALVRAAYHPYVARMGREPVPMLADYEAVVARGHSWVAELHGELVGVLVLEPAADHLLVENVAVRPDLHARGIGGRLLRLAEEQAAAVGLAELRLYTHETMTANIAYYPRRGYQETHREGQDGYGRVFFTKRLTPPPASAG
jgi:N-acetylglutamate synthase-like GNAT family acetyltransferase